MVCPFPQKLLISHWLPVLSGSNPEVAPCIHPGRTGTPNHTRKKQQKEKTLPDLPPPPKKKKKKRKEKRPEKTKGKKRKKRKNYLCESSLGGLACWRAFIGKRLEGVAYSNNTSETFEFSEIYVCQKY